jgi:hypothetical protein
MKTVLCTNDEGNHDLIVGEEYPVLPDPHAEREGYIRIIDESGEDYLYPKECFE